MADEQAQRGWAKAVAQALTGTADEFAGWINSRNDVCFEQDTADFIQALQSNPPTPIRAAATKLILITNTLLQHMAIQQSELDQAQVAQQHHQARQERKRLGILMNGLALSCQTTPQYSFDQSIANHS
jgi:hypothetical protein